MAVTPKVSVLMAAYNADKYIALALKGLVEQSYRDWELVVLDDGSQDRTASILDEWARRESRVRVFRNWDNLGLGPARRKTLELAEGKYAAILDADDVALPEWLGRRVKVLEQNQEVVLASGSRILVDCEGRPLGVTHEGATPDLLRWKLLFGNPVNHSSCMFRVDVARSVGGYNAYPYLEDWDLMVRLSTVGKLIQIDEAHVKYRVHAQSTSYSTGLDRERLEPVAKQIMSHAVGVMTGLTVPTELVWYLFRGRYVFEGEADKCHRALDLILRLHALFNRQIADNGVKASIGAAALVDATNVLRCRRWCFTSTTRALAVILWRGGLRTLLAQTGTRAAIKLALLPALIASGRYKNRR